MKAPVIYTYKRRGKRGIGREFVKGRDWECEVPVLERGPLDLAIKRKYGSA